MTMQMTYRGYCQLGGAANLRLFSRVEYLGEHYHSTTYWMVLAIE